MRDGLCKDYKALEYDIFSMAFEHGTMKKLKTKIRRGRADSNETDMRLMTYNADCLWKEYKVLAAKSVTPSGSKVPTSSLTLSIFIRNKKMHREDSRKKSQNVWRFHP